MNSRAFFAGRLGWMVRKKESLPTEEIGVKSASGSNVRFLRMFGVAESTV